MADQSRTDRRFLPRATSGPTPWRATDVPAPRPRRHTPGAGDAPPLLAVPAVAGWVDPDEDLQWSDHRAGHQRPASAWWSSLVTPSPRTSH